MLRIEEQGNDETRIKIFLNEHILFCFMNYVPIYRT